MRPSMKVSARGQAGAHLQTEQEPRTEALEATGAVSSDALAESRRNVAFALAGVLDGLLALSWHEETRTMLAVLAEGSDPGDAEAALMQLHDVEGFDYEYEQTPDGWFTAELLWPPEAPEWMTNETAASARDHQLAIDLARKPL